MRNILFIFSLFFFPFAPKSQQVGIGTKTPNSFTILDVYDTAHGVLLPRMSSTARLNLPNTKGMVVFDTVALGYWYNDGTGWINLPPKAKSVGDMLYWNGSQWSTIPVGLGGQVLTLSTGTHIPAWKGPTTDSIFTDSRDGQQYRIKQYGSQVWMTQNLNYFAYPSSTCYDKISGNCTIYGRLYDLATALLAVPPGWHLPSDAEWDTLINFLGGSNVAGGAMKNISGWNLPNVGATNSSGFNGMPGGAFSWGGHGEIFCCVGDGGFFWSSTLSIGIKVWIRWLSNTTEAIIRDDNILTQDGASVRCVRDN